MATWVVTPGTSVASRNSASTSFLNRKWNRSSAYAVIVPMMIVPITDATRMIVVLTNARAMSASWNAVTKFCEGRVLRQVERAAASRSPARS